MGVLAELKGLREVVSPSESERHFRRDILSRMRGLWGTADVMGNSQRGRRDFTGREALFRVVRGPGVPTNEGSVLTRAPGGERRSISRALQLKKKVEDSPWGLGFEKK